MTIAFYVIYIVVFPFSSGKLPYDQAQLAGAFFPPLAFQIGTGTFLTSYGHKEKALSLSTICWIMFADIFIYAILAWYFAQVWPSKIGVRKPFYFFLQPSYWFPRFSLTKSNDSTDNICLNNGDAKVGVESVEEGVDSIPTEEADESLLGMPTIVVDHLRKTFGTQKAVNDLSFKMYENQIFALLGHNGAGKV